MILSRRLVSILAVCALAPTQLPAAARAQNAAAAALAGCYERRYDPAHLKAHRGQIVRHVKLSVERTAAPQTPGDKQPIVVDALLQIWAGAEPRSFGTVGACFEEGATLVCNASLSAEEARPCRSAGDGVRDCRLSKDDAGAFELTPRPEGLQLVVRERLELAGAEGGRYHYLGPDNAGNRAFALRRVSAAPCK